MLTNPDFQVNGSRINQNRVTTAIQKASAKTGVDFNYLVKQANVESSMNPNAKARTSSATGLYQFIDQTWLRMMKQHGADHGYGRYADAITQNRSGEFTVSNKGMRNTILNLRKDPQASSLMAAELATENNSFLKQTVGGDPSGTDLYLAHFLGAQGASNFLKSMQKNPWAPAASIFPDAAKSNRGVFYQNGKPLSFTAIYNRFDAKFKGDAIPQADTQVAVQSTKIQASEDGEVFLPAANDWSRPNSVAQRIAANRQVPPSFVPEFTPIEYTSQPAMGNLMRSPVDVMLMAQENMRVFAHEDSNRYNS